MTTSQNTTIQAAANSMVSVMVTAAVVNMIASALGMLTIGATLPAGIPAADRGIRDLRLTFGTDLVDLALKNVGRDDIVILAKEVGNLYTDRMRKKYGDMQTTSALAAAPPGDLRTANEIAAALAGLKVTEATPPDVKEQAIETGKKRAKGRRVAKPQKDTKTGITYASKAKAGMAVAAEYGLDATETFVWYGVIKKDPTRFVPA